MRAPEAGARDTSPILRTASSAYQRKNSAAYATSERESGRALPFSSVISFAKRSASRMISSKALRRISARSRGLRPAQPSKAPSAASSAALASSTVALATDAILRSVAGSITSKRPPSDALRHLPPIHRSVGTLARRFSYMITSTFRSFPRKLNEEQAWVPAFAGTNEISTVHRSSHRLRNPVGRRQHCVFQNIGGRQRNVRRRDANRRTVEIIEGFVCGDRNDLRAPSAQPRIFFNGEKPVRLRDRAENGLRIERHQ